MTPIPASRRSFDSVVVIAGVARSGTSWLGEILNSSPEVAYRFQPIFSYAFKNAVNEDSDTAAFERFFDGIYQSDDAFLMQRDKRESGLYPTFAKLPNPRCLAWKEARHQYLFGRMLRLFPNSKLLAIIRHPCAVINSWLRTPTEFPAGADARSEWRLGACKNQGKPENFFGYYKWKETAHMYLDLLDQRPEQVRIVRYGELVESTEKTVDDIFRFVGLPMTQQTTRFLDECNAVHSDNPFSVFKDKTVRNKWKTQLDPYIAEEIENDLRNTRMEAFLR
jgi:hypothetical protein